MINIRSLFIISFYSLCAQEPVSLAVQARQQKATGVTVIALDTKPITRDVVALMQQDFSLSGRFNLTCQERDALPKKKEMQALGDKGVAFIAFIQSADGKTIDMRLYDAQDQEMVMGKKIQMSGGSRVALGHRVAEALWHALTGAPVSFYSMIAGCKQVHVGKKEYAHLYVFYPQDVEHKKCVLDARTLHDFPRWHPKKPLLYVSQETPMNMRLISVDPFKQQRIITSFDGLNMTPTFSDKGQTVISLTKKGRGVLYEYAFDEQGKRGLFKPLTSPRMHAVSPSFIDEAHIVFCLIDQQLHPVIAIIDLATDTIEKITSNFSVSPTYNKKKHAIAYCKKTDGFMQVWVYDCARKTHKQVTADHTDKDECSWSACGNFIVCTAEGEKTSRLAVVEPVTKKMTFITPQTEYWFSPSWSPAYEELLFL